MTLYRIMRVIYSIKNEIFSLIFADPKRRNSRILVNRRSDVLRLIELLRVRIFPRKIIEHVERATRFAIFPHSTSTLSNTTFPLAK